MNIEKGHGSAARVGVDPGAIQEVILGTIQKTILGTIPKPEPTAKALLMPIPEVCIPHL